MIHSNKKLALFYIFLVLIFTFLFRHFTKGTDLENFIPLIPAVLSAIILLIQNFKKKREEK